MLDTLKKLDNKKKFLLALTVLVILLYSWLTTAIVAGERLSAVFATLTASAILFPVVAFLFEGTEAARGSTPLAVLKNVFNVKKQAWSFIFGDILILPLAAWFSADGWAHIANNARSQPPSWWLLCLLIGAMAGAGFHFVLEKPAYTERGFAASLDSPTKLFHDFVSYPVIFGGLLYAFLPLVINTSLSWNGVAIVLLVAAWFTLGAKFDSDRADNLVPWGHPAYDWVGLRPKVTAKV